MKINLCHLLTDRMFQRQFPTYSKFLNNHEVCYYTFNPNVNSNEEYYFLRDWLPNFKKLLYKIYKLLITENKEQINNFNKAQINDKSFKCFITHYLCFFTKKICVQFLILPNETNNIMFKNHKYIVTMFINSYKYKEFCTEEIKSFLNQLP